MVCGRICAINFLPVEGSPEGVGWVAEGSMCRCLDSVDRRCHRLCIDVICVKVMDSRNDVVETVYAAEVASIQCGSTVSYYVCMFQLDAG